MFRDSAAASFDPFPLSSEGPGSSAQVLDPRPTMLVIAPDPAGADLAAMADGAGFRVIARATPADAPPRLAQLAGVDGLLLDLRHLPLTISVEPLLVAARDCAEAVSARLTLIADLESVDVACALTDGTDAEIWCAPSATEIATGLCLLRLAAGRAPRLHDIGREAESARLDQLSAEVRRLALTIERLASNGDAEGAAERRLRDRRSDMAPVPMLVPLGQEPEEVQVRSKATPAPTVTAAEVRALLQARRQRERYLAADLFADPAWDMMLDLMAARLVGKRVSVSSLCIASAVPPTTALRWISQLTERGLFVRSRDPSDARRIFISLSDEAAESLAAWFAATRRAGMRFTG